MALLDLVFPARCAACAAPGGWPLCHACAGDVGVITSPWCERCGRPWAAAVAECTDCPPPFVDRARAPFLYDGPVADAIKGMKFAGVHGLARHLAAAMALIAADIEVDAITWVPLSRRRRGRRGFDQAEILVRALARHRPEPVRRLLVRTRDARSQARRSGSERREALQDAFGRAGRAAPERVMLVDDVLTTGSTAAACAQTLKAGGTRWVVLLTAARSLGGPVPGRCRALAPGGRPRVP